MVLVGASMVAMIAVAVLALPALCPSCFCFSSLLCIEYLQIARTGMRSG
jgi:hypothetical protein